MERRVRLAPKVERLDGVDRPGDRVEREEVVVRFPDAVSVHIREVGAMARPVGRDRERRRDAVVGLSRIRVVLDVRSLKRRGHLGLESFPAHEPPVPEVFQALVEGGLDVILVHIPVVAVRPGERVVVHPRSRVGSARRVVDVPKGGINRYFTRGAVTVVRSLGLHVEVEVEIAGTRAPGGLHIEIGPGKIEEPADRLAEPGRSPLVVGQTHVLRAVQEMMDTPGVVVSRGEIVGVVPALVGDDRVVVGGGIPDADRLVGRIVAGAAPALARLPFQRQEIRRPGPGTVERGKVIDGSDSGIEDVEPFSSRTDRRRQGSEVHVGGGRMVGDVGASDGVRVLGGEDVLNLEIEAGRGRGSRQRPNVNGAGLVVRNNDAEVPVGVGGARREEGRAPFGVGVPDLHVRVPDRKRGLHAGETGLIKFAVDVTEGSRGCPVPVGQTQGSKPAQSDQRHRTPADHRSHPSARRSRVLDRAVLDLGGRLLNAHEEREGDTAMDRLSLGRTRYFGRDDVFSVLRDDHVGGDRLGAGGNKIYVPGLGVATVRKNQVPGDSCGDDGPLRAHGRIRSEKERGDAPVGVLLEGDQLHRDGGGGCRVNRRLGQQLAGPLRLS